MIKLNSFGEDTLSVVNGAKIQVNSLRVLLNHCKQCDSSRSSLLYDIAYYEV